MEEFLDPSYDKLVRLSAFEGNQSPRYTHPNLRLVEPTGEMERKGDKPTSPRISVGSTKRLGLMIEARILQQALRFDRDIHAISRLDPHYEPETSQELPRNLSGALTHLRRYHIGSRPCSLTYSARRPNELLAPLLACRAWNFIGSHIFYAQNRFLFSSLGEFGRWCSGIGPKIAIVSRVEIFLVGSQHLTYAINDRGRYVSRRTQPLFHLPQCLRLRELNIYLRETAPQHLRRKHETRGVVRYAKQKTEAHPNYRGTRNLHCLQGLDYIYGLRGLESVQFFDYDKFLTKGKKKVPVRDTAFVESVRSAVQQEKELQHYVRSRLRNLSPLLPGYDPPEEVWNCLKAIAVDDLKLDSGRDAETDDSDLDDDDLDDSSSGLSSGSSGEPISLDSDSGSDFDSDSFSDSDFYSDPSLGDSNPDDTKMLVQDNAQISPNVGNERLAEGRRTPNIVDIIDLTEDDDSEGTRHSSFRNETRSSDDNESSLFVRDENSDFIHDYDFEDPEPPLGLGLEEPIQQPRDEESDLFVSDRSVIDLTSIDDEMDEAQD